jgi:hypothetical protein
MSALAASARYVFDGIAYALFAVVAAVLGYVTREVDHGRRVSITAAAIKAASGAFFGLMLWMACRELGISSPWSAVIVGTLSWVGVEVAARTLESIVYRKLGIPQNSRVEDSDNESKNTKSRG